MRVSIVQSNIHWENPNRNYEDYDLLFSKIVDTDLIVLPEMFQTGFSMNPYEFAESMDGPSICFLKVWSNRLGCAICCSMMIKEDDRYYNRFLFIKPDYSVEYYDKSHLFGDEKKHFVKGSSQKIIEWKGIRILPLVCYDLRFPVFSRYSTENQYDVIINVANWPEVRSLAWNTLLKARAIENQSYVIGCNRVGIDGNGLKYCGDSSVVSPLGEVLITSKVESVLEINLDINKLKNLREETKFLEDRDPFSFISS